MNYIEVFLIIFFIIITTINIHIYRLTKQRYLDTLRQLWQWDSYIRRWLKENYNASRSEIS